MKKLVLLFTALLAGAGSALADTGGDMAVRHTAFNYGSSFIFLESGITFSVYPDGEFDFYLGNQLTVNAPVGGSHTRITFNSGYNYGPYVQYDDYGAVIQIENVPIFYDYYGRVSRIGHVRVWYRHNRVHRIGGMYVYYTPRGLYDYHTGYINMYNRVYVYRPFHRYFARPAVGLCLVSLYPYRRYYYPVRYTYYHPYHYNARRAYARVGKTYRYAPRADRDRIYRNDSRVTGRSTQYLADRGISYRRDAAYSPKSERSSNRSGLQRSQLKDGSEIRREMPAGTDRSVNSARPGSQYASKVYESPATQRISRPSPAQTGSRSARKANPGRAKVQDRSGQAGQSGRTAQAHKEIVRNSQSRNNRSGNSPSRSKDGRSGNE